MRITSVVLVLVLAFALLGADPTDDKKEDKPISPAEAAKRINEKCTVEMQVKSGGKSTKDKLFFLNSEQNFRDKTNFTVVIDAKATAKFKEAKIDDPAVHFIGKTIRVTGKVVLFKDKPEIKVEDPDQIKIVEKKN
jgi:DNA/RNA endonuclease YhcR with UshA esterase domain